MTSPKRTTSRSRSPRPKSPGSKDAASSPRSKSPFSKQHNRADSDNTPANFSSQDVRQNLKSLNPWLGLVTSSSGGGSKNQNRLSLPPDFDLNHVIRESNERWAKLNLIPMEPKDNSMGNFSKTTSLRVAPITMRPKLAVETFNNIPGSKSMQRTASGPYNGNNNNSPLLTADGFPLIRSRSYNSAVEDVNRSSPAFAKEILPLQHSCLQTIGLFNNVQLFCRYFNWVKKPSKLAMNTNFHIFKNKIKPMWEDPANANGGKWVISIKNPQLLDRCWTWLVYALVGEDLDEADDICGAVMSRRTRGDRIAVWVRDKDNVPDISAEKNRPVDLNFFFEMPLKRLHYYKKLYMRLLRGSEPGRKDYNLLAEANTHIDALIELEKKHAKGSNIDPRPKRREIDQNEIDDDNVDMPLPVPQTVKYTVINPLDSQSDLETPSLPPPIPQAVKYTVIDPENSQGDLEKDIKSPPIVQNLLHPHNYQWTLQEFEINIVLLPPHLPFQRELLFQEEFNIFLPEKENFKAVEIGVRLFLLTDLLLICRQFTQEEKIHNPLKEFWLLFPPLSGRHLVLEDIDDEDGDLMSLTVLKKDTLILRAERREIKSTWFEAISKNNNKNEMVPSLRKVGSNPNFPTPRQPIEMLRKSPSIENLSSTDSGYDNMLMNNQLSPLQPLHRNDSMSSLESVNSIGSFVETLYQTPPSEICRWMNDEWELFINDRCIVELKMTSIKRPCLVVLLAKNGQMILNSWIHSSTTLFRESKVAVSVSCDIGPDTEYYRFSTPTPADADNLVENITKATAMTNE
ncbi:24079_t:CDS:10, partial [Entrophospora sp. SA101]